MQRLFLMKILTKKKIRCIYSIFKLIIHHIIIYDMKNVFSSILNRVRGYRELNVVAVINDQVVVSDNKGRLGFLTGELTPDEKEQSVVWAKPCGKKSVKVVTQASYHCYDTAELVRLVGENNLYVVKLRVHGGEVALVNANRQYHLGECLAVNLSEKSPAEVTNYVK